MNNKNDNNRHDPVVCIQLGRVVFKLCKKHKKTYWQNKIYVIIYKYKINIASKLIRMLSKKVKTYIDLSNKYKADAWETDVNLRN